MLGILEILEGPRPRISRISVPFQGYEILEILEHGRSRISGFSGILGTSRISRISLSGGLPFDLKSKGSLFKDSKD